MDSMGAAMLIHGDSGNEVQVQKGKVHEVILRQGFMLEMGMDTAKTFQTPPARPIFLQIRDHNLLLGAYHDIGGPALAVDQHPDLATDFKRESANGLREFKRDDVSRRGSSTIKIAQAANLVGLQSTRMSLDFDR